MNLSLKHKLMLQSLSPLAFLTIVRNFKFTPVSELAENQSYWGEFVRLNNVLIVVFLLCATWILAAIISFISFTAFRWTDKKQGYQLSSFVEKEDASLNFFMTMIIPLLIDDVGTIQGAVRDESGYQTKKIRATDKLLSSTKDKVAGFINCTYLADDAEFDTSENIADNKKEFYEISLIENYRPFIFLDDAEKRTEYYSESDRNKLSGFLFRINLNDKYFWVYQHIYSVSRIDRSKNVIALFVGDTYDEIDSDIVQIDSRADVIIFSSSVVTAKMDLMQRFFGFEQYIRAGAQKTIEIIRDLDIVDSLEKFVAFENKSKLTNAKKLLKAKNSPVLQMKKNDLLENLKKHSRYKTMFKFEEDHIVISSQKEAAAFIKMLNDDIVRSELTGKEYDSSSKMLLGPVGASH